MLKNNNTHPVYCEVGVRFLHYPAPANYDDWGLDEEGNRWLYSFSIMDDYGDAIPVHDVWVTQFEDCVPILAPDYDPKTPLGQPYKYKLYDPPIMH